MIYDCFVLNEKAKAVYYHGSQAVLKILNVGTAATDTGKTTILVEPGTMEGSKRYYMTAAKASALTDQLRPQTAQADAALLAEVEKAYALVVDTINAYKAEK